MVVMQKNMGAIVVDERSVNIINIDLIGVAEKIDMMSAFRVFARRLDLVFCLTGEGVKETLGGLRFLESDAGGTRLVKLGDFTVGAI